MTRKDYVLIANALRDARAKIRQCEPEESITDLCDGVSYAIDYITDALQSDNPRFDRARFLEACAAPYRWAIECSGCGASTDCGWCPKGCGFSVVPEYTV